MYSIDLLRISHLLDFTPRSVGTESRRSSKSSFISFRRLRSAILCEILSSGEREYGVSLWCGGCPDNPPGGFSLPLSEGIPSDPSSFAPVGEGRKI